MTTYGPNYSGTVADGGTYSTANAWTSPTNAQGSTNFSTYGAYAGAAYTSANRYSNYLNFTNFGFSIPGGATINGVYLEVSCESVGAGTDTFAVCQLLIGGTATGTDLSASTALPTSNGIVAFGGSSNVWGNSLTSAIVNASNFGATIALYSGNKNDVDYVYGARITVYATGGGSNGLLMRRRRAVEAS